MPAWETPKRHSRGWTRRMRIAVRFYPSSSARIQPSTPFGGIRVSWSCERRLDSSNEAGNLVTSVDSRLAEALRDCYTLERELGHGGMATVYLARDLKHDRLVALKVLRPELSAILGGERFLREIRLT